MGKIIPNVKTSYRNFIILWIRDIFTTAAASLTSSSVLSAILLYIGLSESKIGIYLSVIPAVNFVISLSFSSSAGRSKHIVGFYSALCLASGVITALFAVLFVMPSESGIFFPLLLVLGGLLSATSAVKMIFDYQIPCKVMDLKHYSMFISVDGIVTGISGIVSGAVFTFCIKSFDYFKTSCIAFFVAGALLAVAALINRSLKSVTSEEKKEEKTKVSIVDLWRDRYFRILFVPNILRGVAAGVMTMITVIAANAIGVAESDGGVITTCTYIATFLSCILYGVITPKLRAPKMCLLGALVFCLMIPAFAKGKILFFILYCIAYIGYNIVCNALPEMIYQNVSSELMSSFHTWRLALTTLGTICSTALFGIMLGKVSPIVILIIGVAAHTVMCLVYYLCFRNVSKK